MSDREHIHPRALAVLEAGNERDEEEAEWIRADRPLLTPRAVAVLAAVEEALDIYCKPCPGKHPCDTGGVAVWAEGSGDTCPLADIRRAWKDAPK